MTLLEQIKEAGIVGCGGAGFPAHVKLNCTVEYLIINAAECEPLLRTDRFLMLHKAREIVTAAGMIGDMVQAGKRYIVLKRNILGKRLPHWKLPLQNFTVLSSFIR